MKVLKFAAGAFTGFLIFALVHGAIFGTEHDPDLIGTSQQ